MHIELLDITDRIPEPPKWWINGIPRYCEFTPDRADTFAPTILLVRSECQQCQKVFDVALGTNQRVAPNLLDADTNLWIDATSDDAPFHNGPDGYKCGGSTMLIDPIQVLQAWVRNRDCRWTRRSDLEGIVDPRAGGN